MTDRNKHLSAAPAPSSLAGGEWRDPSEVPEAKKGEYAYRIVAVKRADGEKVVSFSAFYMNAVPLWFEDDNESRNVTGWHSDSEGDDGPTYSPLLTEGDALMGWREFPRWEAALSPEAPARDGVVMAAADVPTWADGIVTDGENVAMAQKAETDHGGHYWAVDGGNGGLDWEPTHFISLDALTPRHEAPAEPCASHRSMGFHIDPCCPHCEAPAEGAGEDVNWKAEYEAACEARISDRQKSQEVINERDKWVAELLQERAALRAQPQAREDAQPVAAPFNPGGIGHAMYQAFNAYLADYVLSTDGDDYVPTPFERDLIEDFFAGLMAEEAFFGPVRALYDTHPAPDALRVALQSVQRMAGNSSFNINQNGVTLETGGLMRVFDDIERIALAALQAEQKGGAA